MRNFDSLRTLNPLRWSLAALMALSLLACGGDDDDPPASASTTTTLSATLSGDQEVVPTATGATGTGSLSMELPSRAVSGSFSSNGTAFAEAHIHQGEVGLNGPIIVPLAETPAGSGTWAVPPGTTLTEAQAAAFSAGGLYFNAHSAAFPAGEIRGQIGREVFAAQMSGAQEVPATASAATGTAFVSLDPSTKKFSARMTLTGLAAVAAHIHPGAVGVNGPVLFPLTQTTASSGIWVSAPDAVLTDAQIDTLKAGGFYFNAHSAAFPGGEIRGQIGRNLRFASLAGTQEVPANTSAASGTGSLLVNPQTRAISGGIALTGLAATAAHIHLAAAGVNGPIIVGLSDAGGGVWSVPPGAVLTADQLKAFKQGNLYFNAHTPAFPGGEIRGQIL